MSSKPNLVDLACALIVAFLFIALLYWL